MANKTARVFHAVTTAETGEEGLAYAQQVRPDWILVVAALQLTC